MLVEIENAGRVVCQGEAIFAVDDILLCQDSSSVSVDVLFLESSFFCILRRGGRDGVTNDNLLW